MTRKEHLLTIVSEECAEVAHRVSKALRFGMGEKEPGNCYNNRERIEVEVVGLLAALELAGIIVEGEWVRAAMNAKQAKIESHLRYSRECGTLI